MFDDHLSIYTSKLLPTSKTAIQRIHKIDFLLYSPLSCTDFPRISTIALALSGTLSYFWDRKKSTNTICTLYDRLNLLSKFYKISRFL